MTLRTLAGVAAAMSMALVACADVADVSVETASLLPGVCPKFGCGVEFKANVGGEEFEGIRTRAGGDDDIEFVSFKTEARDGVTHDLTVIGDEIRYLAGGGAVSRDDLVGARLVLRTRGREYVINVAGAHLVDYWFNPSSDKVPFYDLQIQTGQPKKFTPLCNPAQELTDPQWHGVDRHWVTLFSGDSYDRDDNTLTPTIGNTGFIVACAGTPLAAMHLLRQTTASAERGSPTRRQAVLRMLTGDYCGSAVSYSDYDLGTRYAVRGQYSGIVDTDVTEAVWDEHGAVCLDTPRLSFAQLATALEIRHDIKLNCHRSLPACGDLRVSWADEHHALSAHRPSTP